MDLIEGTPASSNGHWLTRYREEVQFDYYGRRVFRFHRCFPQPPIEYLDVLFAVSVAIAVLAFRLGSELQDDANWPPWASAAQVVDGEPEGDADLTVILVGHC